MRIHHLNCGTMTPGGVHNVTHVLAIITDQGDVLNARRSSY
jgi:hypothetical protein